MAAMISSPSSSGRAKTLTFRELRARCDDISPSVLNQRLAELRDARLVGLREGGGYVLARDGVALGEALAPLNRWAKTWARHGT